MVVWFEGRLVPLSLARIDPTDRGFTLGDGLYETLRVAGGRPERLAEHLARLARGASLLGIPVPVDDEILAEALAATLAANGLVEGVLRVTLTRGPGGRGLAAPPDPRPTLLVTASAASPPPGPASLVVARSTRRNERSPLAQIKAIGALDNLIARREASDRGADDALIVNGAGRVAEATAANLFAVLDGELVTPPLDDGVLPGVVRAALLAIGAARERSMTVADLDRATEIFLSNSLGVRAVGCLEGRIVGTGRDGSRARELRSQLFPR